MVRIVIIILDGLLDTVFLPVDLDEMPVQVLNLDRGDPLDGSRHQALDRVLADRHLVGVDYNFIGTEDDEISP